MAWLRTFQGELRKLRMVSMHQTFQLEAQQSYRRIQALLQEMRDADAEFVEVLGGLESVAGFRWMWQWLAYGHGLSPAKDEVLASLQRKLQGWLHAERQRQFTGDWERPACPRCGHISVFLEDVVTRGTWETEYWACRRCKLVFPREARKEDDETTVQ